MVNFLLGLLGKLLAAELSARCPEIAQKIISSAAKRLPHSLQHRMLEEWSALLDDTPGDLSKLCVAISLYWKRSKIADESEEAAESPVPTLVTDILTDSEEDIFVLVALGKTDGEISNLLDLNRTVVEYLKITSVQKLSGQSNIGRKDLVSFLRTRRNYSCSKFRSVIGHFRRARHWRYLKRLHGL